MHSQKIVAILLVLFGLSARSSASEPPNIVVIFTDDQGYGDLGCYGSTTIRTPRLDSLAKDGTKFTSFYAQVVCGPSRSALLTGRYPNRSLGWSMPASEVTVAQLLKQSGYATGCIGKWDVSNRSAIKDRMPNAKGFDYYFGTLGANDDGTVVLHENETQLEKTSDMASLTRRYTDKSIEFVQRNKHKRFFLFLAHTMTHSVIDASPEFKGKSGAGLYGDTVEELDFHCGRLLDAIDENGLREKTLVIFTTDNGPWNNFRENLEKKHGGQIAWGSSGPLREGKGSTYEGGLRVPCLARWPGKVTAGRTSDAIFATIDFLPTFVALATGATSIVPKDRIIDGVDQTKLLLGENEAGARKDYFYFCKNELHAVRHGEYKLFIPDRRQHYGYVKDKGSNDVELYNLAEDIGEKNNLAKDRPDLVRELMLFATSVPQPDCPPNDKIGLESVGSAATRPDTSGKQLVIGDWEKHGFSSSKRDEIRKRFQNGVDGHVIPGGCILIIHQGEVVLREAFGVADLKSRRPFSVDSPCYIASITKPHAATLLAILESHGKLNLDDSIDKYLPEFKELRILGKPLATRVPTLRECLSHTAGFAGNDETRRQGAAIADSGIDTLEKAAKRLANEGLVSQPGAKYDYSRSGYIVAGRVAEVVTGRTFQDLLRRHLLEPIGAQSAGFTPSDEMRKLIPVSYQRIENQLTERNRLPRLDFINPAGGLVSTLDDVGRFMLLHRNGGRVGQKELVPKAQLAKMYIPQPGTAADGYGLGFNIVETRKDGTASRIRHTGASGTFAMLDFDRDLIVVILTQVDQPKILGWRGRLLQAILE